MATIKTTLTTSGNSVAVRLPKELLRMSELGNNVKLEAKKGKIIITKNVSPREGWAVKIKALAEANEDPASEFDDMDAAATDGLDNLPWNDHGKLS